MDFYAPVNSAVPGAVETESVFQGYVSRDRRKPHVAKADQAAEQLLRRARAAGGLVMQGIEIV